MSAPDRQGPDPRGPNPWTESTESEFCPFCPTVPGSPDPGADLIHEYTRAQAIADGVLVDVSREASPAEMHGGFTVPVAITSSLWAAIRAIPERLQGIADPRGRLHDVLWMAGLAARRSPGGSSVSFVVHLLCAVTKRRNRTLALHVGPDDDGAPCVTIGFPEDF